MSKAKDGLISLTVRNHPGVMYHITGLFSRRSFNLEGILCGRIGDGSTSKMYLLVGEDYNLNQVIKQLNKLHDVLEVSLVHNYDAGVFERINDIVKAELS